jgi:Skp family chaperone for outer membrane proteins
MKKITTLAAFLILFASCSSSATSQNEENKYADSQRACSEYIRAYDEEENLDPFAEAVVEQLNIPELTLKTENLNALLNQIEDEYPGLTSEDPNSSNFASNLEAKFGPLALSALQTYGQMFTDVDKFVRDSCSELETNTTPSTP